MLHPTDFLGFSFEQIQISLLFFEIFWTSTGRQGKTP
jgi:hypothetical protein